MRWDAKVGQGRIYYASTSRQLIDDVAQLLLRVGVFARIKRAPKVGYRDWWHLYIYGAENQLRFLRYVGVHGVKSAAAQEVLTHLEVVVRNTNLDTVPKEIWAQVRESLSTKQMTHRQFASRDGYSVLRVDDVEALARAGQGYIVPRRCSMTPTFIRWQPAMSSGTP